MEVTHDDDGVPQEFHGTFVEGDFEVSFGRFVGKPYSWTQADIDCAAEAMAEARKPLGCEVS